MSLEPKDPKQYKRFRFKKLAFWGSTKESGDLYWYRLHHLIDDTITHASGLQQPRTCWEAPSDEDRKARERSRRAIRRNLREICLALTGRSK